MLTSTKLLGTIIFARSLSNCSTSPRKDGCIVLRGAIIIVTHILQPWSKNFWLEDNKGLKVYDTLGVENFCRYLLYWLAYCSKLFGFTHYRPYIECNNNWITNYRCHALHDCMALYGINPAACVQWYHFSSKSLLYQCRFMHCWKRFHT